MPKTIAIPGQRDLVAEAIARSKQPGKLLDIGTGAGFAARGFFSAGWDVTATGYAIEEYLAEAGQFPEEITLLRDVDVCDMHQFEDASFDVVWCAHVIEHVLDTGRALSEIRRVLKPDGRLFLTVPPFKHAVVGGHVSPGWNVGILMYVLAVAGFGVHEGSFVRHRYNVFADVGRGQGPLKSGTLEMANGDLEILNELGRLPKGIDFVQGFDGDVAELNWTWLTEPVETLPGIRPSPKKEGEPMRIVFLIPWLTKGRGGTENVGRMMANAMSKRGHTVKIITFDDAAGAPKWPLDDAIELIVLPEDTDKIHDTQICVEIAAFSPDLIVGLHMNRGMVQFARVARRLQIPLVVSEHGEAKDVIDRGNLTHAEREMTFNVATYVHVLNDTAKQGLAPATQQKLITIPNTVGPAKAKAKVGQEAKSKSILFVGRLVERKNAKLLMDAFATLADEFPDWRISIVGDGPERCNLEEQAVRLSIEDRVGFAGETEDPYPFFEDSELFCLPSISEIFGLVTLEAMAHGIPVVAMKSAVGSNLLVEHGVTGFLATEPMAQTSLCNALRQLMQDAALRKRLGDAGFERYSNSFAPEIIETAWEDLFRNAVNDFEAKGRPSKPQFADVVMDQMIFGEQDRISGAY